MEYVRTKIVEPVQSYLRSGLEPVVLARSSAVGFTIGISPLVGLTALVCAAVCLVDRRLHAAMVLVANFCAMPFEVPLILPFMRLGETVTGSEPMELAPKAIWQSLKENPWHVLIAIWHSMVGWALVAVPVGVGAYFLAICLFKRMKSRTYAHMEDEDGDPQETTPMRGGDDGTQMSTSSHQSRSRSPSPRDT